jgi:hypothetical protein
MLSKERFQMRTLVYLLLTATCIATLALAPSTSSVFASDPVPIDPTLTPVVTPGGPPPAPSPADPFVWWNNIIPLLASLYPNATYAELCLLAESMFNLLPPVTPPV